jgi:hypothetical protein
VFAEVNCEVCRSGVNKSNHLIHTPSNSHTPTRDTINREKYFASAGNRNAAVLPAAIPTELSPVLL